MIKILHFSIFFVSSFGEDVILRSFTALIRLIRESTMLENIACLASTLSLKKNVTIERIANYMSVYILAFIFEGYK